jgi:hypothetical protein
MDAIELGIKALVNAQATALKGLRPSMEAP